MKVFQKQATFDGVYGCTGKRHFVVSVVQPQEMLSLSSRPGPHRSLAAAADHSIECLKDEN